MDEFKFEIPEEHFAKFREGYMDLVQAHERVRKARAQRNRGIKQMIFGAALGYVGVRMLKNQKK